MSIWEKMLNREVEKQAQPSIEFDFSRFKKEPGTNSQKVFVFGTSPANVNENFASIVWTPKKSVIIETVYCYTTMDDVPISNFFLINEYTTNANVLFQSPDSQSIQALVGDGLLSVLRLGFDVSSDFKTTKILLVGGVSYSLFVEANQAAAPLVAFRGFCYIGYKEVDL